MLLNLVRLRYQDSILFLDLTSVVASYQRQVSVGGSAEHEIGTPTTTTLGVVGNAAWTESPTITYAPLQGEDFAKRLLAPIQPTAILLLSRSGWGLERLLICAVQQLNEVPNGTSIGGIAPVRVLNFKKFRRVAVLLRELQEDGYIQLNTLADHPDSVGITQGPTPMDDGARAKADEVLELLAIQPGRVNEPAPAPAPSAPGGQPPTGAKPAPAPKPTRDQKPQTAASATSTATSPPPRPPEPAPAPTAPNPGEAGAPTTTETIDETVTSVAIQSASFPRSPATLTLSGRSILGVLTFLAQDVEVPAEHIQQGLVRVTLGPGGQPLNWHEISGGLFTVHSSKEKPERAFLAVQYRGYWFYIDDRDIEAKGTYALVAQLFSLQAANASGQAPILTIPTR
jgi:hypothetical protein